MCPKDRLGVRATLPCKPQLSDMHTYLDSGRVCHASTEEPADASVIREAHSDSGYWYWLARQPEAREVGGR